MSNKAVLVDVCADLKPFTLARMLFNQVSDFGADGAMMSRVGERREPSFWRIGGAAMLPCYVAQ